MNTFRDKGAIMNKDFVLDFVAGGMISWVHTTIAFFFLWRCVGCSEQDSGGSTGEGQAAAPDSGQQLLLDYFNMGILGTDEFWTINYVNCLAFLE